MSEKLNIGILTGWHVNQNSEGSYFLPYSHFAYLSFITSIYRNVWLISPVMQMNESKSGHYQLTMPNLILVKLPNYTNFISAQLSILSFIKNVFSTSKKVDVFYCRVPDPFSWLPALITKKPVIMHFVGDSINATNFNEKWSWIKKKIMIGCYLPDYFMTLLAARKSIVYTNGFPLSERMHKFGINGSPVISSTILAGELSNDFHELQKDCVRLTYIGYLRYAKGIKTIKNTISLLEQVGISYQFNIVGDGEMFEEVEQFIKTNKLSYKIRLFGHVDDRMQLNNILKQSDLFFFPSLSEGSPRVVIEAMSQGVPVLSTPVGSLPSVFKDGEDIRFFDFNDSVQAVGIIEDYMFDNRSFLKQRQLAFQKVKEKYTLEAFLSQVFSHEK